jgi:hypothetical protein
VAILLGWQAPSFAQSKKDDPETVMVTYQVKPGAETELKRVIERHWATLTRLNLVRNDVHLLVRVEEKERVRFVEIGTWRDRTLPENAPAEVQALWKEMNQLVEARDGHQGIEVTEVTLMENARSSRSRIRT